MTMFIKHKRFYFLTALLSYIIYFVFIQLSAVSCDEQKYAKSQSKTISVITFKVIPPILEE